LSDKEIIDLCRQLHLDIVIDLNGWTAGNRFSLFTNRLAPIQISYLGYLGTTGSDCFDYIIADEIIIPPQCRKFYTEKIIYLPSFQVNDSRRQKSKPASEILNDLIPQDYFVFCCFNNSYKITPLIFDTWISILNDVPKSILLLSGENTWATENLLNYAHSKGINKDRIYLLNRASRDEYLSRYSVSNLFLDTFPYCAGTTASDSLWSGVPVLTCMGNSFASRMGASILNSIGLHELITTDLTKYHKLAVDISSNPSFYFAIREKLRLNLLTFPLFNSRLFTKNIEKAFVKAHQNRLNGLKPDHIFIDSDTISF
jgi:predicted O-linked N-acetylglucosamine transferase (SPINDLY family)